MDPGPARQAEQRVVGLYPEGKVPDSPRSSCPSSALLCRVFPLYSSRQSQDTLPSLLSLLPHSLLLSPLLRMKQSATQSQFLLFFFLSLFVGFSFSSLFSPSLCSQATTQLKWFAAAKKISLFCLSLSLSLSQRLRLFCFLHWY